MQAVKNTVFDYEAMPDDAWPTMFEPQRIQQHQARQWAKVSPRTKQTAKATGSWVQNEPGKVLAIAFACLIGWGAMSGGETSTTAPDAVEASVAEAESLGEH